jgi:hypothetical protein
MTVAHHSEVAFIGGKTAPMPGRVPVPQPKFDNSEPMGD